MNPHFSFAKTSTPIAAIAFALLPVLALLTGNARAQNYPSKPITMVVGYPPGAGTDVIARIVADRLGARFGQAVIIDNKAGASGTVGLNMVAKSPADGYTFLVAPNTLYIAPHVLPKGSGTETNVLTDLVPIVQLSRGTMVMVATPSLGVKDAKELAALAKAKPGEITFATPGSGSPMHIAGELFNKSAGVKMTHVPYKGSAPAMTDLLGGHVKTLFGVLGSLGPHILAGRMTPIAVVEKTRSPLMPNLPTMAEQGFPGVEVNAWYGVFAPKGTPAAVVEKMNQEINAVLAMPEVQAKFKAEWEIPVGGTSKAFADEGRRNYDDYGKIVKEFNIVAE